MRSFKYLNAAYGLLLRQAKSMLRFPTKTTPGVRPSGDLQTPTYTRIITQDSETPSWSEGLFGRRRPNSEVTPRLVFYTDGSVVGKEQSVGGAAVVCKRYMDKTVSKPNSHAWGIIGIKDANSAEMLAVAQALRLANAEFGRTGGGTGKLHQQQQHQKSSAKPEVLVLTDSFYTLSHIERALNPVPSGSGPGTTPRRQRQSDPGVLAALTRPLFSLKKAGNVNLEFGWVRGHAGTEGNNLADRLARAAAWGTSRNSNNNSSSPIGVGAPFRLVPQDAERLLSQRPERPPPGSPSPPLPGHKGKAQRGEKKGQRQQAQV